MAPKAAGGGKKTPRSKSPKKGETLDVSYFTNQLNEVSNQY
jgi:hypothetical protein